MLKKTDRAGINCSTYKAKNSPEFHHGDPMDTCRASDREEAGGAYQRYGEILGI